MFHENKITYKLEVLYASGESYVEYYGTMIGVIEAIKMLEKSNQWIEIHLSQRN